MRPVTLYSLARRSDAAPIGHYSPQRLTIHTARVTISAARKTATSVHVYETTDRDGIAFHIGYVHYGPERWDNGSFITDIYVIPTAALTDL
ncbi:hypothetical protein [Streptomyces sp. NPDC056144]|uniref:hypothetical protein n=1 Tax=unclassified Streptomyces TaxID=2593676 RepID=UPI0035DBE799